MLFLRKGRIGLLSGKVERPAGSGLPFCHSRKKEGRTQGLTPMPSISTSTAFIFDEISNSCRIGLIENLSNKKRHLLVWLMIDLPKLMREQATNNFVSHDLVWACAVSGSKVAVKIIHPFPPSLEWDCAVSWLSRLFLLISLWSWIFCLMKRPY